MVHIDCRTCSVVDEVYEEDDVMEFMREHPHHVIYVEGPDDYDYLREMPRVHRESRERKAG